MKEKIFLLFRKIFKCKRKEIVLIFLVCLFFLVSILIISNGYLLLGGEGNYFTDFKIAKDSGSVLWSASFGGIGFASPTINGMGVLNLFLLLQNLDVSIKIINTLSVFLIYVLPFLSILWLFCRVLKINFFVSFMVSLFYILNPFSTNHLQGLMLWNVAPFVVLPLIFGLIYKYYSNEFKLFFIFGLTTSLFAFSFANIPYLGIFHIFLIISIISISYIQDAKLAFGKIIKNFLIIETSFSLFNLWWLLGLARFYFKDLGSNGYSNAAVVWLKATSGGDIVNKIFSIKAYLSPGSENFFSVFYFSPAVIIILFIPVIVLVWRLFVEKTNKANNPNRKKGVVVFVFLMVVIFLNKGYAPPFQELYLWMMINVPFFEIFKTPLEKFSVLFVFLLSLNLVLIFQGVKSKFCYGIFIFYLLVCSIPYITLNFIPEYKVNDSVTISRKFVNKDDYIISEKYINQEKTDYRYLSLPGSLNYQETIKNHGENKYYQGMNPIIYAIDKTFIATYSGEIFNAIFDNLSNEKIDKLLALYNIKRIMINSDIYPFFGFKEKESIEKLDSIFSERMKKIENGSIKIYNNSFFLPHFYVPKNVINSIRGHDEILKIILQDNYDIRSAIFFRNQNDNKKEISSVIGNNDNLPVSEFKKINQAKYRIRIHGAKDIFPLVFSESFHNEWKIYPKKIQNPFHQMGDKIRDNNLNDYKILDGNKGDQANDHSLNDYLNRGWVTSLGDRREKEIVHKMEGNTEGKIDYVEKYKIDFISKNFQGTIQNDNLSEGNILETIFEKPIDESNHLMANGYANSWIIDVGKICSEDVDKCIKNPDGTYDIEFVVEFWPQRLYYIGLGVFGMTLVVCLIYLTYDWLKKMKDKSKKMVLK